MKAAILLLIRHQAVDRWPGFHCKIFRTATAMIALTSGPAVRHLPHVVSLLLQPGKLWRLQSGACLVAAAVQPPCFYVRGWTYTSIHS